MRLLFYLFSLLVGIYLRVVLLIYHEPWLKILIAPENFATCKNVLDLFNTYNLLCLVSSGHYYFEITGVD